MRPGITGDAPFHGTPTPVLCPGCGDRLFSMKPGCLKCELCGVEINVPVDGTEELQDGWGGKDVVPRPARPARAQTLLCRQKRKTGALAL
jgi:hypothetical protein